MILGNNAAGFPHAFIGTSTPQSIGIGTIHGILMWGRLDQSVYSPMPDSIGRRFMTGMAAVYVPRGIPGLEVGGARFFHLIWPRDGLTAVDFLKPFEAFLKGRLGENEELPDSLGADYKRSEPDNQLASVFARWVFPRSGFEIYGEFAREDHNYDVRDLILELTHNSGYMVGMRKAWQPDPERIYSLRAEVLNAMPGHTTLARDVQQFPFYIHGSARQGHTQYGQALGSGAAFGGAETVIAVDAYRPEGRWTLDWRRTVRSESEEYRLPGATRYGARRIDVIQALGAKALFFAGRFDISAELTGAYEFNRDFQKNDEFNLHASLGVRAGL
jgi:hypothetical protein